MKLSRRTSWNSTWRDLARAAIAGNLPYYITSPILDRTVRLAPPRAVFLVQKEVAARLVAHPGQRDYGFLTVRTAVFADARRLFDVKPGAFRPPPKVDSAVVLLEPRAQPLPVEDAEAFVRFVGQCFRHKRKTIRNNLAEHLRKRRGGFVARGRLARRTDRARRIRRDAPANPLSAWRA